MADTGGAARVRVSPSSGWVAVLVLGALALGGVIGYLVGDGNSSESGSASSTTHTAETETSVDGATTHPTEPASDLDLGLQESLHVYLDALVSHDWQRAHDLMCADLSEQISPGSLKRELASSEANAGPLRGYEISKKVVDDSGRSASVDYVLEFEAGSIDITAEFGREGTQWRVCAFTNTGGTGAFTPTTGG